MKTNPELEEWLATAVGVPINPDGHYGLQCVDVPDGYAQAIFGVPWARSMGGVNGARELLDAAPDEFWIRTDNDPNDPALIPSRYDVVVFGGTAQNEWGHTGVCESADANGMWLVQQDGFAPPLVFVDGAWYSNKPCHRAWLPYWGPGTGLVIGWLTPREEKIVNYAPSVVLPQGEIKYGYQRDTVKDAKVGFRRAPSADAELISWLEPDHRYDFKGFVVRDGQTWFVGRYSDGFSWAGGFTDEGTHDLPDLTAALFPPPPPPPIVPPAEMVLHGFDCSSNNLNLDVSKVQAEFVAIKASEGNGYKSPSLESQASGAGTRLRVFFHWARPDLGNTPEAELDWFLSCVRPLLRQGDVLAIDWEEPKADLSNVGWVDAFLTGAQAKCGGTPLIYAGNRGINAAGAAWAPVEARFPLWYPSYQKDEPITGYHPELAGIRPPVEWASGLLIWQYTRRGRLPGYEGDLDLNVAYTTVDKLKSLGITLVPSIDPEPSPVPVPGKTFPTADQPIRDLVAYYTQGK